MCDNDGFDDMISYQRRFTVLFEDSAALVGLVIAFAGIAAAQAFDMPQLDGAASIGIALVLGTTAVVLARRTKELLIGESAHPVVQESILRIAHPEIAILFVKPQSAATWRLRRQAIEAGDDGSD